MFRVPAGDGKASAAVLAPRRDGRARDLVSSAFPAARQRAAAEAGSDRAPDGKMALVAAVILMACVIGLWKMGSATASEEEPPAQWESAAIASAAQSFADASEDELMAQWIIKDLSEDKVRD